MTDTHISLGLITKNQLAYLRTFIENYLKNVKSLPAAIRLIIVNDGSSDGSRDYLETIARKNDTIAVVNIYSSGRAFARNKVLEACTTQWLAFTDTDCVLDDNYFKRLALLPRQFENATAVEGYVYTDKFNPYLGVTHFVENTRGGMFVTANMVLNVPKILKLGGFNLNYGNFREDADLGLRIIKINPIPFWEDLKIKHPRIVLSPNYCLLRANGYWKEVIRSEHLLFADHPLTYKSLRRFVSFDLTLNHWCKWHAIAKLKYNIVDCLKYMTSPPPSMDTVIQSLKFFLGQIFIWSFVYLWEQWVIIYHGKLNKTFLK